MVLGVDADEAEWDGTDGPADQSLIAAAQSGSVQAFTLLIERRHPRVLRYLLRQTGDPELAADLAQETFLDAFRSLDRLPDDYSFDAWLYRIARHNLLTAARRRGLWRLISLDWLPRWAEERLAARQPGGMAALDERDAIQRVLDTLSAPLREALILHSLWGFTSGEVAAILGIAPATARQRIARAKGQFRERYGPLHERAGDRGRGGGREEGDGDGGGR